jgi:hypothetical protein
LAEFLAMVGAATPTLTAWPAALLEASGHAQRAVDRLEAFSRRMWSPHPWRREVGQLMAHRLEL